MIDRTSKAGKQKRWFFDTLPAEKIDGSAPVQHAVQASEIVRSGPTGCCRASLAFDEKRIDKVRESLRILLSLSNRTMPAKPFSIVVSFFVVSFFALTVLLSTSQMLPLTWDEGESYDRTEKIRAWFHCEKPLSKQAIEEHWIFTTQIEGHPAGYGLAIAAGHVFSERFLPFLPQKTAFRFGPIFLFAIALGAVFVRISTEKNLPHPKSSALFSVAAILLTPRLFAHAHIAACDSTLTACWLLAWSCFEINDENTIYSRKTVLWGVFLGATLAAKFTGWIAMIPFFLATCFSGYCERKFVRKLLRFSCGLAIAILIFFVLNPPLWFDPIHGFIRFIELNTARDGFNIAILFFGKMYNFTHPLPWYNTLVWVGITIPSGFLFLICCTVLSVRKMPKFSFVFGIFLHALVLLVVRAFPGTPPHDGTRLFITAFAFLAILAGITAGSLLWCQIRKIPVGGIAVALIYCAAFFNMCWYAPQWLSYYNLAIAGLPGAKEAGMEPTYYWDALDREVADWLHEHTAPNEIVLFSASSRKTLTLQKKWNEIQFDFYRKGDKIQEADLKKNAKMRFYVLQRRPSGESLVDRVLIRAAKPVYVKTIRKSGVGPWGLSEVPILEIYDFQDYMKARAWIRKHRPNQQ